MDDDIRKPNYFRRTNVVWTVAVLIIIFVFIFSMFHLHQRGEYKLDDAIVNYNYVPAATVGLNESYNLLNSTAEETRNYIPNLELQYANASVNNEPYQAQECGMRLALAYLKIHDRDKAAQILNNLIATYSFDQTFVAKCKLILKDINRDTK